MEGEAVTAEGLWALLNQRVRIDSSRYPGDPAVGKLMWVGADPFVGAICAYVQTRGCVMRYIPIKHVEFFAAVPA